MEHQRFFLIFIFRAFSILHFTTYVDNAPAVHNPFSSLRFSKGSSNEDKKAPSRLTYSQVTAGHSLKWSKKPAKSNYGTSTTSRLSPFPKRAGGTSRLDDDQVASKPKALKPGKSFAERFGVLKRELFRLRKSPSTALFIIQLQSTSYRLRVSS